MEGSPGAGGDQTPHHSGQGNNQLPSAAVKSAAQALAQGRQPTGVFTCHPDLQLYPLTL